MVDLREWAEERPAFNLNEAQRALNGERNYLKLKIHRAVERGEIKRIQRGVYTAHSDPLIYSTHIEKPSYVSLWTGLRYYDLTTQVPTKVHVMTGKDREDLGEVVFHYTKYMFGFRKQIYRGFEISVAEKEKLLIDCLSRSEVPVSELTELIEDVEIRRFVELAERTSNKSLKKRAGYLFEEVREETVEELKTDDRNYPLLDLTQSDEGEINSEWRLKVNTNAV
ncbi:MAG: hypothetical protein SV377_05960 [Halobacteria archaeon]|nr:hypothetical protein [Halobacteria archaeon]